MPKECDGPAVRMGILEPRQMTGDSFFSSGQGICSGRETSSMCDFGQLLASDALLIWGIRTVNPYVATLSGILEWLWGGSRLGSLEWNFPPCLALLLQHSAYACSQRDMGFCSPWC